MTGQPIIERNGKFYIKEYRVPSTPKDVYFDNYDAGVFYEEKGPFGTLLSKKGFFHKWVRGVKDFRREAESQVKASRGAPVIWRVGADQIRAFEKALEDIGGITIVP